MRRASLVLVVLIAFGSFSTNLSSAAVTGSKCTKAGATKIVANKKYTCIKSGKKLLWDKGKPLATKIEPTLKPTPTSTPTPTPTPTPTQIIDRKDWELVYLKIWDEYNSAQNQGKFPFIYKLSPNVNKAKADESIAAYDKAMKPWLAILNGAKVSPVVWVIMSEKDYAWWKELVDQQEGTSANYAWNPTTNMLGHCQLSPNAFCGYGNTFKSNTPDYKFLQYNVIGSSYTGSPNANTVNHESVHFYQLSVVQGFPRDIPCWYVEGQASLYGGALQNDLLTERKASTRQRDNFKGTVRRYQPEADSYKASDWIAVLNNMYPPHISCSGQQDYFKYATGMFIWEYLYATYGPQVMHQVLLDFKDGKLFVDAIQRQLNVNLEQLNQKLADHLVHIFADGN
ncbi:MAG: hypothetical protein RJB54_311 [Actinomycetota bacterium]|jgi:hypothetical protein